MPLLPLRAFVCLSVTLAAQPAYTSLPTETPASVTIPQAGFDYAKRSVMIPMRDGVKLHTVIIVPRTATASQKAAILLTRTPYDAKTLTGRQQSKHMGPMLQGYDNATDVITEGGYIRVVQDIRGKYGSEGDYVMNRPLRGPRNPTPVDHATDTYDTIDYLVKNIPECNGKVGILGISYDGFLPLMALVNPHPALKVSVPMNPMVDGWIGDDWFHNGAFRQQMMPYIFEQQAGRGNEYPWASEYYDEYEAFLKAGSAGELGRQRGMNQVGFWRKIVEHPSYDAWWRDQAVDKVLAKEPLKVPTMIVHSLWDQEDIYGAIAVYKAVKPKDVNGDMVRLVIGPWYHGQMIGDGSAIGQIKFHSDTARHFRREVLAPYLAQHLKDGAPKANIAPVTAFETGVDTWRELPAWPPSGAAPRKMYLQSGDKLAATSPTATSFVEYISDPAKPVPYKIRPVRTPEDSGWPIWLCDDQREASSRTDVVTFTTDVLTEPLKISGEPLVHLVASTSGSDADWVVKLIDVYPDEVADQPVMGGYQHPIAMDIFRGRYRESFETPKALEPDKPLAYKFALPTANHVFLPGHKIMVQVQSSWFPLYDRNPQTFVSNIFLAKPEDYKKATHRVYIGPSYVELPVNMSSPR
ncbi:MAG: CocE/NonD family hydrolase [Acidobacteria bacterium]|nr:CocE/NonD family hydrolase [Acidobacteriota bacterium]